MADFPLSRNLSKPVYGNRINWGNNITHGLCFASAFNEYGSLQCQSLVSGTQGVFAGSTKPSWKDGYLFGPNGAETVAYLTYGAETSVIDLGRNTSNPATWIFRTKIPSALSVSGIAARNDGNTVSVGWQIQASAGTLFYWKESSVTNMLVTTDATTFLDRFATYAIVVNGSLTATEQLFYINGILRAHVTNTNGAGTPGSDSAQTLYVGRTNANYGLLQNSLSGELDCMYMWKRALSATEVMQFTNDPYIPFRYNPKFMFARRVIGGGNNVGKGGGSKKSGGGAKTVFVPGGATYINIGNAGLDAS